ncbi:MAG: hypothetical protein HN778_03005 [Prolixibacteraceae bacterium]|jgi:hypothetical protein|nr:hypothetical protein [Prolixibacteraceae bacterium]MBT6764558.1 hypothetical protein [Prolixibacteraceae bacterium]MBT6996815.1 hypothetical protein [Prolixibacteraceae bacterium]MBT7393781.1 hypothetical protein [Prolixibacteraceae bacterium]
MILTDYYKGEKLTDAKSRYDITTSTGEYDLFESLLINKRGFNVGGLSFYCGERPDRWKKKNADLAISKGSHNITSLTRPDLNKNYAFGDINGTNDGCIIVFNPDFKQIGINTIEIFIARGLRNDVNALWDLLIDMELKPEMEILRHKAVTKNVTGK